MEKLPTPVIHHSDSRPRPRPHPKSRLLGFCFALLVLYTLVSRVFVDRSIRVASVPIDASSIAEKCRKLDLKPGPPPDFHRRAVSDRFQPGTRPTLIRNATIWTGRVDGLEVVSGDLYLEGGIIHSVAEVDPALLARYAESIDVLDAHGAWVSPGCVSFRAKYKFIPEFHIAMC